MVLQTKCVRYYMVFHRALALMKRVLAAERAATDANDQPGGQYNCIPLVFQLYTICR